MSHGIMENDKMFSVLETPWHKLGTVVTEAPTIKEALHLSGMDWNVQLKSVYCKVGPKTITYPNRKAVIRMDNLAPIGMVGPNYKPLQNVEAFEMFEPLIESGKVTLETAGTLFNGQRTFILAKITDDYMSEVEPGDPVVKYILLSNSHDGSTAVKVGFTPIRVVCNNTLSGAECSEASKLVRVYHQGDVKTNVQSVMEIVDVVNKQFMATTEQYKILAKKPINSKDLQKYVRAVFSQVSVEKIVESYDNEQLFEELQTKTREKLIPIITEIFENDPNHNAWGMYNAVNGYFNHHFSKSEERNMNTLAFGANGAKDAKALKLALAL